ncbi:MAG TPA: 50S ribosomal protein L23 [Candidatus Paceibacterota bacterium]|nr:50S ribosomal protein L23 [Candidatus Paceibacterota bacterium]
MAIFGGNKKEGKKEKRISRARAAALAPGRAHAIVLHPWYTEKALLATDTGVYGFAVARDATKPQIAAAIKELYGVAPRKVAIVNTPGKRVSKRTRPGKATRAARRKAYVYLNAGEKIEFA